MGNGLSRIRAWIAEVVSAAQAFATLTGGTGISGFWRTYNTRKTCLGCETEFRYGFRGWTQFCGRRCQKAWTLGFASGYKFAEDRTNVKPYPVARRRA